MVKFGNGLNMLVLFKSRIWKYRQTRDTRQGTELEGIFLHNPHKLQSFARVPFLVGVGFFVLFFSSSFSNSFAFCVILFCSPPRGHTPGLPSSTEGPCHAIPHVFWAWGGGGEEIDREALIRLSRTHQPLLSPSFSSSSFNLFDLPILFQQFSL